MYIEIHVFIYTHIFIYATDSPFTTMTFNKRGYLQYKSSENTSEKYW